MNLRSDAIRTLFKPLLITTLASAVVLAFVHLDLSRCQKYLERVDAPLLLLLLLIGLLRAFLRAWRLRMILPDGPGVMRLSAYHLLYQLMATLLPFKMGEATLPILLKRDGIPLARSLAVLVLVRLMDLVILLLYILLLMTVFHADWPDGFERVRPLIQGGLVGGLVLTVLFLVARPMLIAWVERGIDSPVGRFLPRKDWLRGRWEVFHRGISAIPARDLLRTAVPSLLLQLVGSIQLVFMFAGLEPAMIWTRVVVGEVLINVANLIPLQGLASLGTFEAIFVMVFASLGMTTTEALALSIVMHLLSILPVILLGLGGWVLYRRR